MIKSRSNDPAVCWMLIARGWLRCVGAMMSANEPKFTPGPWLWIANAPHDIYLATTHSGRRYVMGFRRWGFNGAQPVFQENSRLVDASTLLQFEVGDKGVIGYEPARNNTSVYRYEFAGSPAPMRD